MDLLAMIGKALVPKVLSALKDRGARWLALNRAIQGRDLAREGSLKNLVQVELIKLFKSSVLPPELKGSTFLEWALAEATLDRLIKVLIAESGAIPVLGQQARAELARSYEQTTGEAFQLATGRVDVLVALIYGQFDATDSSKRAFMRAIGQWNAAQIQVLISPDLLPFPQDKDLERLKVVSEKLAEAGRAIWKMPMFVAPLALEMFEDGDSDAEIHHPITIEQLIETIEAGSNIVLSGDGGIGKTTLLLQLASVTGRRTGLYSDAATWARSGLSLLDYLANTPHAQAIGITSADLIRLAKDGFLAVLINGWNEIPAENKRYCHDDIAHLITAAPALAVVVTSRTSHDTATLPSPKSIAVQGLSWKGLSAVVRAELNRGAADVLLESLTRDVRLRHAARSPLILRGLIAQAQKKEVTSTNTYDLLSAVVMAFESDKKRELMLREAPLFGRHALYLEEIACNLNEHGTTTLSRDQVLATIGRAAKRLVEKDLLGTPPQPLDILDHLASYHVLHVQNDLVRFSHQRFQEYFAASRVLQTINGVEESARLLSDAVNRPVWADSLELVAEKLKGSDDSCSGRACLVRAAEAIDVTYACDLAGQCAFIESDDRTLYGRLVSRVNELSSSSLTEVQDLAIACQIASRMPIFADRLWSLFESDDRHTRLNVHRVSGTRVSLKQLGPDAEMRISAWPSDRRAELLHEIAVNSENYDFIVRMAVTDPAPEVRVAAISSLSWGYPISMAAINAWRSAPLEVQTAHELLSYIDYALEQDIASDLIRSALKEIAASEISDETRLQLVLICPEDLDAAAVDAALLSLGSVTNKRRADALISIAQTHALDRLSALALDLVARQGTPEWVGEFLRNSPREMQEAAFERAWNVLQAREVQHLRLHIIGPLSTSQQTRRSLESWLHHCLDWRGKRLSDAEMNWGREIRGLLKYAPGLDLLDAVMDRSVDASYEESVELAQILLNRITWEDEHESMSAIWSMTSEQFKRFFDLLKEKNKEDQDSQDALFVFLACIASHIEPMEFGDLILVALRRQLDAWTVFRSLMDEWRGASGLQRPSNPIYGNNVISALVRWGMDSLLGVVRLMSHQSASELIPQAIARIAGIPWVNARGIGKFGTTTTSIQEGCHRRGISRALQQPSDADQPATDAAAKELATLLNTALDYHLVEREENPGWNARQAAHQIGTLAGSLANIPSAEGLSAVTRALSKDFLDIYRFVGVIESLVRQGWIFSDVSIVREFEALYDRETQPEWVDESTRHILGKASQLMLLVEPTTLLKVPCSHYLSQWQRFSHPSEVMRGLSELGTDQAWFSLIELGKELSSKGQSLGGLSYAISSMLSSAHFSEFVDLVADGRLFLWCSEQETRMHVAPAVANVVKSNPEQLTLLIDVCRRRASDAADALLSETLRILNVEEACLVDVGLEALDSGRVGHAHTPAYSLLMSMFTRKIPLDKSLSEISPKACNTLRQQLYLRARKGGEIGMASQRILAALECMRREDERPADEPRHPGASDGVPWTNVFLADASPDSVMPSYES